MKPRERTLFIAIAAAAFLLCTALPPQSAGDYYIVYGKVYQWDSSVHKYLPANGITVRLECSTGTYYDTTHYNPYYGNGFYEFMASEVGRPDGGTVICSYSQTFEEEDIPARRDFYIDEIQSSFFLLFFTLLNAVFE